MIKEFVFINTEDNSKKKDDVYLQCKNLIASKKDFIIKFENFKVTKSYQQLKGIHKLCQIYGDYLKEATGDKISFDNSKLALKYAVNYTRLANHDEAFSEVLRMKREKEILGIKLKIIEFNSLVKGLQLNWQVPKSFTEASLEEMQEVIQRVHQLGIDRNWHNLNLTNQDMQEMINYYQEKND